MKMYEIHPAGDLAASLKKYYNLGGVIDYVLMRLSTPIPLDCDARGFHRVAASFTIKTANARNSYDAERGPRIECDKANGTHIDLNEFFAPPFVWIKSADFEASPYIQNPSYWFNSSDVKKNGGILASTGSYAKVFYDPPYGFPQSQAEKLFPVINQLLFGEDMSALTIYRWSTDWADYFNPGDEWWGSYLWIVFNAQTNLMVGIAASATD